MDVITGIDRVNKVEQFYVTVGDMRLSRHLFPSVPTLKVGQHWQIYTYKGQVVGARYKGDGLPPRVPQKKSLLSLATYMGAYRPEQKSGSADTLHWIGAFWLVLLLAYLATDHVGLAEFLVLAAFLALAAGFVYGVTAKMFKR